MNFIKKFIIVTRAFSFTVSGSSVILGSISALVFTETEFNPIYFVLAWIGMVVLHAGANILNDIYDYKKGIDREVYQVSGGVVRGIVSIKEAYIWSITMFAIGISIGIFLALNTNILLLAVGFVGVLIGIFYSSLFDFRDRALGDLSVFVTFGILGSLGGWVVQTGEFSWLPILWGVPSSLLVIAILHSNNWRDIERDTNVGCKSVASIFGDSFSEKYYFFLIFMPFVLTFAYIFVPNFISVNIPALPLTSLLVLLALPMGLKLRRKALFRNDPEKQIEFIDLDGVTSGFHFVFVMLSVAGLLLMNFLGQAVML